MAYNAGEICDWFENGTCSCFLNGSRCDCPFSNRGCQIQCEKIFKEKKKIKICELKMKKAVYSLVWTFKMR